MPKHLESTAFFAGFVSIMVIALAMLALRDSPVNPHYEEFVRPSQSAVV